MRRQLKKIITELHRKGSAKAAFFLWVILPGTPSLYTSLVSANIFIVARSNLKLTGGEKVCVRCSFETAALGWKFQRRRTRKRNLSRPIISDFLPFLRKHCATEFVCIIYTHMPQKNRDKRRTAICRRFHFFCLYIHTTYHVIP